MGLSIANQVDQNIFFSMSSITKTRLKNAGLNLTIAELKNKARQSPPYMVIFTGDKHNKAKRKQVNLWRYGDFK